VDAGRRLSCSAGHHASYGRRATCLADFSLGRLAGDDVRATARVCPAGRDVAHARAAALRAWAAGASGARTATGDIAAGDNDPIQALPGLPAHHGRGRGALLRAAGRSAVTMVPGV